MGIRDAASASALVQEVPMDGMPCNAIIRPDCPCAMLHTALLVAEHISAGGLETASLR